MSGVGRECDLMRHRQGRERRGKRTGRELTTSEVGRRSDQRYVRVVKEGRDPGRGRVRVAMGREGDTRRCGGGQQKKRVRTQPRTGVGDTRDRKGSDLGSVKGDSRGRGDRTGNWSVMCLRMGCK